MKDFYNVSGETSIRGVFYPVSIMYKRSVNTFVITCGDRNKAIKAGRNATYVYKCNARSLSTCSIDMLFYILSSDNAYIANIAAYYFGDADTPVIHPHITRAAFYRHFDMVAGLDTFAAFFDSADSETRQLIIRDHMCGDHTAKMSGMLSFSTSVELNHFCACRMRCDKAICKYCFAYRQLGIYAAQRAKLRRAHYIATRCKWCADDIPVINAAKYPYFRLEAFGDLNNTLQVENYNLLADVLTRRDGVRGVTLWTKNPGIIQAAINAGMTLSDNLVIGLSSLELNTPEIEKARKYKFIRFVFTVYDDDYIAAHNIVINCGALWCLGCLRCYRDAARGDDLIIINERKK